MLDGMAIETSWKQILPQNYYYRIYRETDLVYEQSRNGHDKMVLPQKENLQRIGYVNATLKYRLMLLSKLAKQRMWMLRLWHDPCLVCEFDAVLDSNSMKDGTSKVILYGLEGRNEYLREPTY